MKNFKFQRNIWIFAGLCFMLAIVISAFEGKFFTFQNIFNGLIMILDFFNAYFAHKKIPKE